MPPIIIVSDWSKLAGSVFSQANQAASQKDIDLSKVWADILNALKQAGHLLYGIRYFIFTSSLMGALDAYFLGSNCGALFSPVFAIMHPYAAAGALIFISAIANIGVFMTLLQLTGTIAVFLCLLPVQLIVWCCGFRNQGVAQGSFASQYQSNYYGGTVPRGSGFSHLQSVGATTWIVPSTLISLLSYAGVAIVLGREWGWWLQ
ncbi:hypothetical protein DFJ58DRAFT_843889 [Suillus subalutaceus]|uniref:uncharacterized protein n=1 Tax=Suillus subalutaceus TaxID=48586 RepID=UPI001B861875|nr:uncharacterized protein DFJ58DRAFT_843889 [Suillus subalutaceus]KAG1844959.1 hypothetical protein DFJ58DRAFT_843889 [Suillus subalutaceus]